MYVDTSREFGRQSDAAAVGSPLQSIRVCRDARGAACLPGESPPGRQTPTQTYTYYIYVPM